MRTCWNCGSPNHLAYQCPEPRQDQQQNQEEESKKKDDDDINNLFIGCMVVADYTDNDEGSYDGDSDEDEESSIDSDNDNNSNNEANFNGSLSQEEESSLDEGEDDTGFEEGERCLICDDQSQDGSEGCEGIHRNMKHDQDVTDNRSEEDMDGRDQGNVKRGGGIANIELDEYLALQAMISQVLRYNETLSGGDDAEMQEANSQAVARLKKGETQKEEVEEREQDETRATL